MRAPATPSDLANRRIEAEKDGDKSSSLRLRLLRQLTIEQTREYFHQGLHGSADEAHVIQAEIKGASAHLDLEVILQAVTTA